MPLSLDAELAIQQAGLGPIRPVSPFLRMQSRPARTTTEIIDEVFAEQRRSHEESIEASFRLELKRVLRRHGFPPTQEGETVETVIRVWQLARN